MGDLLSATMTSKMRSYTDNPLYFLIEEEVKKKTTELIDYPIGTSSKTPIANFETTIYNLSIFSAQNQWALFFPADPFQT